MALPNVTPAQLAAIAAITAWVRDNELVLKDALGLAKTAGQAFGNDPTIPPANQAIWQALATAAQAAINSYPTGQ